MAELSATEAPTTEVDLEHDKIEEEKETAGPNFHCDLCDTEVVHKVAESFLPGLATASVDNTAGGLFNTPGSVAADLRKEMVDYLTQRSESFVAEFVVLEGGPDGEVLDNPFEIISTFVDDFAIEKRNLFSRFSGWLLSERREDRIDDIVQEMEMNGFWSLDRRQAIAATLVKNVDFKNLYHCSMKFHSLEELSNHLHNCSFRSVICHNQGCDARFCASHLEKHDSACPFKIIPCEQKCPDHIMRRDMDRHCITKCPMKLVNCPFYAVGCKSPIAQCLIEKHRSEELHSHVLYILQGMYKEASKEDLKPRVEQILQISSNSRLAEARDVRYLTSVVKDLDSKLEPLVIIPKTKNDEENNAENEVSEGDNVKEKGSEESTETSNKADSSEKAEVSAPVVDKDSTDNNNTKKEDSDMDKKGSEQSTETSTNTAQVDDKKDAEESTNTNTKSSSDEVDVSDTNTAQVHNKDKDAEDSNEESTKTDMKSTSDEVATTNKETTESNMNNTNTDNKLQGNDNEESTETSKITNKDTAENDVKKKDIEDNALEDKSSEGRKEENVPDKAEVTALKKDTAESDGS